MKQKYKTDIFYVSFCFFKMYGLFYNLPMQKEANFDKMKDVNGGDNFD